MKKNSLLLVFLLIYLTPIFSQSTYIVNTTDDADDGTCDAAHCSFREAINASNNDGGASIINFDLTGDKPYVISPTSILWITEENTTIDVSTMADFQLGDVVLSGELIPTDPLEGTPSIINVSSNYFSLYGVKLDNPHQSGIGLTLLMVSHATIGSIEPNKGNIFQASTGIVMEANNTQIIGNQFLGELQEEIAAHSGIACFYSSFIEIVDNWVIGYETGITAIGDNISIQNNTIGTDEAGEVAIPNYTGIYIGQSENITIDNNLISGNTEAAIDIIESKDVIAITNNTIGTDRTGTFAIPNGTGIDLTDCENMRIRDNLISGNLDDGIHIKNFDAVIKSLNTFITGNKIGVNRAGTAAIPNSDDGIVCDGVYNFQIGIALNDEDNLNIIAGNGDVNIYLNQCDTSFIVGNIIGVDISGENILNASSKGILVEGSKNIRIGNLGEGGNLIGGCETGIAIEYSGDTASESAIIHGNYIGTNTDLTAQIPNRVGIELLETNKAEIGGKQEGEGNFILNNTIGIEVNNNAQSVHIRQNSMSCNTQGIVLSANTNNDIIAPSDICATTENITGISVPNAVVEVFVHESIDCANTDCQGKTYLGTAQADANGDWSLAGIFTLGDQVTATATDALLNTSEFGICAEVQGNFTVAVNNDGPHCEGENIQLSAMISASEVTSIEWTGPNGYTSEELNPKDATAPGWYYFQAEQGCIVKDSTLVEMGGLLELSYDEILCMDGETTINGQVYNIDNPTDVLFFDSNGMECDTLLNIALTFEEDIDIEVTPTFEIFAGQAVEVIPVFSETPAEVLWTPSTGLDCDTCMVANVIASDTTTYTITAFTENGCASTATFTVDVKAIDSSPIIIPNVFHPNSKSGNASLQLYPLIENIEVSTFQIYDRWGSLIYDQAAGALETMTWDGTTSNGTEASAGIYILSMSYSLPDGTEEVQHGTILLLR